MEFSMAKKWYVVHTLSGSESRAKRALEDAIRRKGDVAEQKFGRILLPEEEVVEVRNGKKRTLRRKKYPGYLFVEVDLENDSQQEMEIVILTTPRISGIMKRPLPQEEVDRIEGKNSQQVQKPKILTNYDVGDEVRIIEGAFASMLGTVEEVIAPRQKLRVKVNIFGRLTSVDLDYAHVEHPE
jgi:transcriptional antiterminator NusG